MLNNCSILLIELADNRDEFSFEGSDEWLLLVMIFFVHYAVHNNFDNYHQLHSVLDSNHIQRYFLLLGSLHPSASVHNQSMLS